MTTPHTHAHKGLWRPEELITGVTKQKSKAVQRVNWKAEVTQQPVAPFLLLLLTFTSRSVHWVKEEGVANTPDTLHFTHTSNRVVTCYITPTRAYPPPWFTQWCETLWMSFNRWDRCFWRFNTEELIFSITINQKYQLKVLCERGAACLVRENVILGHRPWRWSGEQMLQSSRVYLQSQYTHTVSHWASCSGKGSWPSTTAQVGQETFLQKKKKKKNNKQNISRK